MAWIKTIHFDLAQGKLKKLYQRVRSPNGSIDNIMLVHSLRPHSMEGHLSLYKNVLHHANNELPKWYLEAVGIYVSLINQCHYCVVHHFRGLSKLLEDKELALAMKKAMEENCLQPTFSVKQAMGLKYAQILTQSPTEININLITECRQHGFTDGEILELNQVAAYFNYANRTVLGLGVGMESE